MHYRSDNVRNECNSGGDSPAEQDTGADFGTQLTPPETFVIEKRGWKRPLEET